MFVRSVSTSQRRGGAYIVGVKDYGSSKDASFKPDDARRLSVLAESSASHNERRRGLPRMPTDHLYLTEETRRNRVTILIGGKMFETYQKTLDYFPETLLGNQLFREHYFDTDRNSYIFNEQCFECFNAILFFYQSKGILRKPSHIKRYHFLEELRFFKIHKFIDKRHQEEYQFLKKIRSDNDIDPDEYSKHRQTIARWLRFERQTIPEKIFYGFYLLNLTASVFLICVDHLSTIYSNGPFFKVELLVNIVFTIEYFLLLYSSYSRIGYFLSTIGLLDLFTVLPFYLDIIVYHIEPLNRIYTIFHFIRSIRIFKFVKLSNGFHLLLLTLSKSMTPLALLFLSVAVTGISFATVVYYVEMQSSKYTMFNSVFDALWYAVITLTGVGYGDVYPTSPLGKLCGGILAVFGVLLFCMPATMLVSKFIECYYLPDALSNSIDPKRKRIVNSMRETFLENS